MSYLRIAVFFVAIAFLSFSCVPNKQIVYLQETEPSVEPAEAMLRFMGEQSDDLIRPGDELYIRITSADEGKTSFEEQSNQVYNPALISYVVDAEGNIKLPYIGKVQVANSSLGQASDLIESMLSQYLYFPSVFIKYINNKVTVLGEVNRPGVYVFDYKNINILQAIGYAGDISEYGNRKNVAILRETGSERQLYKVDITSAELLTSEWYLLKSNDIIYVEPLKRKKWDMNTVPYNLILSIISTSIVIMTFINTK